MVVSKKSDLPALMGGTPVRNEPLPPPSTLAYFGKKEIDAVVEVLQSKSLFRYYGPQLLGKVRSLERALASEFNHAHALCLSSGTAALRTALASLGIGPGSEVIVPACSFVACAGAVITSGAVPVFAECDTTLTLDTGRLSSVLTESTRAIMVTHLKGMPARMTDLKEFAKSHGLYIIEDASQAFGATYNGKRVGALADVTTLSFQLNKSISSGEGGAALYNSGESYARGILYHDQGMLREFQPTQPVEPLVGENFRMTEISAVILLEQLRHLPGMFDEMRNRKRQIRAALGALPGLELRKPTDASGDDGSALCMYLQKPGAARFFRKALNAENITCENLHKYLAYFYPAILNQRMAVADGCSFQCPRNKRKVRYKTGMCPDTESLLERAVSVPLSPALTEKDCDNVIVAISKVMLYLNQHYDASFEERYKPSSV